MTIHSSDRPASQYSMSPVPSASAGTLNHKYTGENAIRAATPHYCVVRSTGLTTEEQDTRFLLEASQGDRISGKISRAEVAAVIVSAINNPAATG